MKPYKLAALGGTFSLLHQGHKEYLKLAFVFAEFVNIYVKNDEYAKHTKSYEVEPYKDRIKAISEFLDQQGYEGRYSFVAIDCIERVRIDHIQDDTNIVITSPEYIEYMITTNSIRMKKGLNPFIIVVKERLRDKNNIDISSTRLHNKADKENANNIPAS